MGYFRTSNNPVESLKWLVVEKVTLGPRGCSLMDIPNLRECKWIHTLDTVNHGLNEYEDITRQVSLITTV